MAAILGKQNGNFRATGLTGLSSPTPRREKTLPQVYVAHGALSTDELPRRLESNLFAYRLYRLMRADPTISLARTLAVAPLVSAGWSVESKKHAPTGAKDFIADEFERHEVELTYQALTGFLDFGWAPFEKIHEVDDAGMHRYSKFKPLLQSLTWILVDPRTGELEGVRQYQRGIIDLDLSDCVIASCEVEGTDFYGRSAMEVAKLPYERWNIVEEAATRYDAKLAGSHWVVKYPPGSSSIGGTEVDNAQVANTIISTLQSSGAVTVPQSIAAWVDDTNHGTETSAWSVELLSDKGGVAAGFTDRQKYLDCLKVRAMGFPERAMLEGQFGTKAESEVHGDLAFVGLQLRHSMFTRQINRFCVNQLLELNYGPAARDTVYLAPNPVSDVDKNFLQQLYQNIMKNPNTGMSEIGEIDTTAMRGRLGVPTHEDAETVESDADYHNPEMRPGEQNTPDDYAARVAGDGHPHFTGQTRAQAYDPAGPQLTAGASVGRSTAAVSGPIMTKQDVGRYQHVLDSRDVTPNKIIDKELLRAIGLADLTSNVTRPGVDRPQPVVARNVGDMQRKGLPQKSPPAGTVFGRADLARLGIVASSDDAGT